MTKRANKGGEVAPNGEFYKGGRFINTIAENPKKNGSRTRSKKAGKREVAPFAWEVQPNVDSRSIYQLIAGTYGYVEAGVMILNINPRTLAYYGDSEAEVRTLAERWNNGERWT